MKVVYEEKKSLSVKKRYRFYFADIDILLFDVTEHLGDLFCHFVAREERLRLGDETSRIQLDLFDTLAQRADRVLYRRNHGNDRRYSWMVKEYTGRMLSTTSLTGCSLITTAFDWLAEGCFSLLTD